MWNDITEKEWSNLVRDVHMRMAKHVQPYLASISKTDDNTSGMAHGSGVYLELKERVGLLTCHHVVNTASVMGYRIAHLPKAGAYYHAFKNPWVTEPSPADLALTYIGSEVWSQGDRACRRAG
jgi:hypothetical protein